MLVKLLVFIFCLLTTSTNSKEEKFKFSVELDSANTDTSRYEFVKLEYTGESDKPYPIVIFYLPNTIDTAYEPFVEKIEVNGMQFKSIINSIENKKEPNQSAVLTGPFRFTITKDQKAKYLTTTNKAAVEGIFLNIIKSFHEPQKTEIYQRMKPLITRLSLSINTN